MADIQQWRRKIQPARTKTPAAGTEAEDSDELFCPNTPKQRLRRKVSSYFDFGGHYTKPLSTHDEFAPLDLPVCPANQMYPEPKAEEEIDAIMCILMANPCAPLDRCYNCSLMRIFESFAQLAEDRDDLHKRLEQEVENTRAAASRYNMALKDWQDERQEYKEEVKRLEVLLSKASRRGLAEVTLARQESRIRQRKAEGKKRKETIFEFLEKTKRYDDKFYSSQRATMKPMPQSPSYKDKRVSHTLAGKKSMTNILADLPFGTPPEPGSKFSLAKVSVLEEQPMEHLSTPFVRLSSVSDSTFSSFSYEAHQPETEVTRIRAHEGPMPVLVDNDYSEMERVATALARRRNVNPNSVVPQLLELFALQPVGATIRPECTQVATGDSKVFSRAHGMVEITSDGAAKRKTVKSKASGFFHRLIPQTHGEGAVNVRSVTRRFSFEPGDDKTAFPLDEHGVLISEPGRKLRKSVSLDALNQPVTAVADRDPLSPVAGSPTASLTPTESRPATRIPTPTYKANSYAKPRQQREDSASSLLTAIKHVDDVAKQSNSLSSSVLSSPPPSSVDRGKYLLSHADERASSSTLQSNSSNSLLENKGLLRGGSLDSSAARNVCMSSMSNSDSRRTGGRGAHATQFQEENKQPLRASNQAKDHQF